MSNFALAFGERRFPPPPRRFCGCYAARHESRLEVAETAKAKKIAKKFADSEKVSNFATFFAAPEKEPRKEHIERFTIDKSSTRAFVRVAGLRAAQARTKILCQFYQI